MIRLMRIAFLILKDYRFGHSLTSGPIGLSYLASAAKARFPEAEVTIEVDADRIIAARPDIIGISSYTESYSQSSEAARYIRRKLPNTPLWLGGPHINALPMTLGKDYDLGVVGEGEETFVELLELYQRNQLVPEQLAGVKGLVYWDQGERKQTPARDTLMELDQIVAPDRSILKTYWPPTQQIIQWPQPIYTSRGCPFKCVFCIFSMDSQKVRYHSVERVVLEIEDILRHYPGQEHISIHDDLFALSKNRLRELVKGIREAGLHKKVSFVCMAKASVFSDEMAMLMRDMNVSMVTFGLESGVERILKYLKGERNKVSDNVKAIDICARHGIRMGGYFIIGTPHETYAELQQAYWFIRENFPPMSMAGIYRLTPFPGTKFWQEAIDMGVVSNDLEDWKPFSYLDQEQRDYLFFNQHYSLEDFKAAYPHFVRITDRNHLAMSTEKQELSFKRMLEPVYHELLKRMQPKRVLEFSGFTRFLAQWAAEEEGLSTQVDLLRPWEWDSFEPEPAYDLVIANLALEQLPHLPQRSLQKLKAALAPGGRLLVIGYQAGHLSLLSQLLTGRWNSDFWGSRPFDLIRFVNPRHLPGWLGPELPLEKIEPLEIPIQHTPLQSQALELLRQQLPEAQLQAVNQIAWLALSQPLQAASATAQTPEHQTDKAAAYLT